MFTLLLQLSDDPHIAHLQQIAELKLKHMELRGPTNNCISVAHLILEVPGHSGSLFLILTDAMQSHACIMSHAPWWPLDILDAETTTNLSW